MSTMQAVSVAKIEKLLGGLYAMVEDSTLREMCEAISSDANIRLNFLERFAMLAGELALLNAAIRLDPRMSEKSEDAQ